MKGKKKKESSTLYLRDVPQELKEALIAEGNRNNRSMSAEAVVILATNCGVKLG